MRILVHDHCGHPFPVQLSRELARRGHAVLHLHCSNFVTGKGALARGEDDPPSFAVEGVDLGEEFAKYSFFKRMSQERRYGELFVERARKFEPEVVISGNTPLLSQKRILGWCQAEGITSVHWLQDVISRAMRRAARSRAGLLGDVLGRSFVWLERGIVRRADAVVAISEDFAPLLRSWGVPDSSIYVVPNWAPLDELPERPRDNAWAQAHELTNRRVFLYAGTLGIKHNPDLLLQLALRYRDSDVAVVVCSEGRGADWLSEKLEEHSLANLVILPYQAWEAMPDVLASGDVLVVILEPEAGAFSVPSKILAYHCAGRPILAALPASNLAAKIIEGAGSGTVVDPCDTAAFVDAAQLLADDDERRKQAGQQARHYAEETFDVRRIAERFDGIFTELATGAAGRGATANST